MDLKQPRTAKSDTKVVAIKSDRKLSEPRPRSSGSGREVGGKQPKNADPAIATPKSGTALAPNAAGVSTSPKIPTNLTKFEQQEVKDFKNVYFTGLPTKKKNHSFEENEEKNPFDDPDGYYQGKIGDHLEYRYEILDCSGRGNFSEVFKARDHKPRGEKKLPKVAVKVLRDQDAKQNTQLAQEIDILYYLRRGDPKNNWCIIRLYRTFRFRRHFCIVFDCLYMDLYTYMKQNDFAGLEPSFLRSVAAYILRGMEYLNICGVIHADLKPENVMLCSPNDARVKLVDFGWSWRAEEECKFSTEYFQSRFSRAPEVILGGPLSTAVDMWSYGCILAELAFGTPVFAGEDRHDQLACIIEVMGCPPARVFEWRRSRKYFSSDLQPFYCYSYEDLETSSLGQQPTTADDLDPKGEDQQGDRLKDFVILMGCMTEHGDIRGVPGSKHMIKEDGGLMEAEYRDGFVDFLLRCFTWLPWERWSPTEASYHRWIAAEYRKVEETIEKDPKKVRPGPGAVTNMMHRYRRSRARMQRQKNDPGFSPAQKRKQKIKLEQHRPEPKTDMQVITMLKEKFRQSRGMKSVAAKPHTTATPGSTPV